MQKVSWWIVVLVIAVPRGAEAVGRFALGPEIGPTYQTHRDPSGDHLEGATTSVFGLAGVYQFDNELSQLAIDYSVGATLPFHLHYRNITINGVTGAYREEVSVLHWLLGFRYYVGRMKWRFYSGVGCGVAYYHRMNVEFRDAFGNLLPQPPYTDHLNVGVVPAIGVEYRPTFRWALGVAARPFLVIRSAGMVPAVQFPITIHIAF